MDNLLQLSQACNKLTILCNVIATIVTGISRFAALLELCFLFIFIRKRKLLKLKYM